SRRRHTRLVSDWSSDVCSSDLAAQGHARALEGEGGEDARGDAGLHVEDAVAEDVAVGDPRRERIARPPAGQGIDVDVAVQHDGAPPSRPGEPGYRLLAPRLDLLQFGGEALIAQIVGEPLRARRLLGREGGDADQLRGEADDLLLVDAVEDLPLDVGQGGDGHGRADSSLVDAGGVYAVAREAATARRALLHCAQ